MANQVRSFGAKSMLAAASWRPGPDSPRCPASQDVAGFLLIFSCLPLDEKDIPEGKERGAGFLPLAPKDPAMGDFSRWEIF